MAGCSSPVRALAIFFLVHAIAQNVSGRPDKNTDEKIQIKIDTIDKSPLKLSSDIRTQEESEIITKIQDIVKVSGENEKSSESDFSLGTKYDKPSLSQSLTNFPGFVKTSRSSFSEKATLAELLAKLDPVDDNKLSVHSGVLKNKQPALVQPGFPAKLESPFRMTLEKDQDKSMLVLKAQIENMVEPHKAIPVNTGDKESGMTGSGGPGAGGDRNSFLEWLWSIAGITTTTPSPDLHPPSGCEHCICGQTNKKNRIVGGQETEVNEYPWMALLMYSGQFYCGGSLLNDRYVLTAAHCVSGFKPEKMSIRLLEHNRETVDETQTITRKVARVVRHAKYSNSNYNNDIALLRLDTPVPMGGPLRPVCMPAPGKSFSGFDGIVTGWGATEEHGSVATSLQEVTVPIMSNIDCRKTAYGESRITDNMMCAGLPEGTKDSCQGDSGGPLHVINGSTALHHIVGIVSWGEGCAQADYPGVYTRVNRYTTWIRSNTADACYC